MKLKLKLIYFLLSANCAVTFAQGHLWEATINRFNDSIDFTINGGEIIDSMNAIITYNEPSNYTVARTEDGGKTFQKIPLNATYKFDAKVRVPYPVSVSSPKKNVIYLGCWLGVLAKTTDNGSNWQIKNINFGGNYQISHISMFDELHGIAYAQTLNYANEPQKMYVTHDGWETWQNVELPDSAAFASAFNYVPILVQALSAKVFLCTVNRIKIENEIKVAYEGLYRTEDGGKTWKADYDFMPYNIPKLGISPFFQEKVILATKKYFSFTDSLTGYCLASSFDSSKIGGKPITYYIAKTTDAGATWNKLHENNVESLKGVSPALSSLGAANFEMNDDNNIVMCQATMQRSSNGGKTWSKDSIQGMKWEECNTALIKRRNKLPSFIAVNRGAMIVKDMGSMINSVSEDKINSELLSDENVKLQFENGNQSIEIKVQEGLNLQKITIFSSNGDVVASEEYNKGQLVAANKGIVSIGNLSSGVYFLKIQTEKKLLFKKFTISK